MNFLVKIIWAILFFSFEITFASLEEDNNDDNDKTAIAIIIQGLAYSFLESDALGTKCFTCIISFNFYNPLR